MERRILGKGSSGQREDRVEVGKANSVQIMKSPITQVGDFGPPEGESGPCEDNSRVTDMIAVKNYHY